MAVKKKNSDEAKKKTEVQLRAINNLATRLPWIVVIVTLISMIFIFIEISIRNT